jgi:tricorn protease-like protein
MSAKHLSLRGLPAWFATMTVILGGFGGRVQAKLQDATAQDTQDKKDEKKDEKKDDKKGLSLKPTRKIEFTTDEGTWLSLDVSPDGKTIVFELVGDIYTLPIEGGTAKLIDGGMAFDSQPKFSPDGKWIAFISDREGSENVWIMHSDGSGVKQVSKDPNNEFASPCWSPDGHYIFVSKAGFGINTF